MPFRIGLSGLQAAAADLEVTGNNIANTGTIGFKESRAEFANVYSEAYGYISKTSIGSGVRLEAVTQQFSQGNLEYTENALDLGINGEGFFVLDNNGEQLYTRAGAFQVDKDGYVVNSAGQRLQVYPQKDPTSDAADFNVGQLSDLKLPLNDDSAALATSNINMDINLRSDAEELIDPATGAPYVMDTSDPDSYNYSTSMTVYDSEGTARTMTMYFAKTANPLEWNVYAELEGLNTGGTPPFTPTNTFTVIFDSNGNLDVTAMGSSQATLTFDLTQYDPVNGATIGPLDPTTATATSPNGLGVNPGSITLDLSGMTQYGSKYSVNDLSQDGYTNGRLIAFDVNQNGVVYARYTNGRGDILGQVAMANFDNPQGLQQVGDNNWAESFVSGQPTFGVAGDGRLGAVQSGALEAANVDLAEELVNLITAQRNYQANAQTISTADQITQTIINIR